VHLALAKQHISQWALEENAAYFKRALLVEWLTAWLAVVIKQVRPPTHSHPFPLISISFASRGHTPASSSSNPPPLPSSLLL
jgi:hypothetical protein